MTKMNEEEIRRVKQYADKIVANAEAVTRETLAACRAECEERVKRVIADSDAKVSGSHVRKMKNITDCVLFSDVLIKILFCHMKKNKKKRKKKFLLRTLFFFQSFFEYPYTFQFL